MQCDVVRESLSALSDGERPPVPTMRIDEHLATCASCVAYRDRLHTLNVALRRPAPAVLDGGLVDGILAAAAADPYVEYRRRPDPEMPAWLAAGALAFVSATAVVAAVVVGGLEWVLAAEALLVATTLVVLWLRKRRVNARERRSMVDLTSEQSSTNRESDESATIVSMMHWQSSSPGPRETEEEEYVMSTMTVPVEGLHCNGCADTITNAVAAIDGVVSVTVDLNTTGVSQVTVETDRDIASGEIATAISSHGNFTIAS